MIYVCFDNCFTAIMHRIYEMIQLSLVYCISSLSNNSTEVGEGRGWNNFEYPLLKNLEIFSHT